MLTETCGGLGVDCDFRVKRVKRRPGRPAKKTKLSNHESAGTPEIAFKFDVPGLKIELVPADAKQGDGFKTEIEVKEESVEEPKKRGRKPKAESAPVGTRRSTRGSGV